MKRRRILISIALLVTISPAVAPASDFAELEPDVTDAITLLDLWIEEQLAYRQIPGLAIGIVHDQELIWARGYGSSDLALQSPVTPATPFRIGSVTKVFTATAILQLRDAGKLRLDDPITRHLPEFSIRSSFPDAPEITVWNLLTHTAGLPREAAFPYWTDHQFPTSEQLLKAAAEQALIYSPGTRYKYSNLGVSLLGIIIERTSGESYGDYVANHIFAPLGMTSSSVDPPLEQSDELAKAYMRRQPDGARRTMEYYEVRGMAAMGSIVSTVEDMAKFAALHTRQRNSTQDGEILSTASMREMQRPHWVYPSWSGAMGLGFRIAPGDGGNTVSHGGWIGDHRSHLLLAPDRKLAVIVMTNAGDVSPYTFSHEALDLIGAAFADGARAVAEKREAHPSWERYLGLYSDPWGWEYRVLILGGDLVIYSHDYPPAEGARDGITRLEPVEGTRFKMDEGEYVVFELDDSGSVERVKRRTDYLFPVR